MEYVLCQSYDIFANRDHITKVKVHDKLTKDEKDLVSVVGACLSNYGLSLDSIIRRMRSMWEEEDDDVLTRRVEDGLSHLVELGDIDQMLIRPTNGGGAERSGIAEEHFIIHHPVV